MRLILAAVIRRFDIKLSKSSTEESMAPIEHFFVVPKSMECKLVLTAIES
jgi:hypothetical protein